MFDVGKLTPAHTMATLVVAGAILDGFNLYEPLLISLEPGQLYLLQALVMPSFMAQWKKPQNMASLALLPACLKVTSAGVSAAIIFGFIGALLFKPKG